MRPRPGAIRRVALVTDCLMRKGAAAVRALGRAGVRVVACETTGLAPGLLSRYAWRRVVHPAVGTDRGAFLGAIERACVHHRPQVILAMEEETLLALLGRRERFEALGARLPYAPAEIITRLGDKLYTTELARALGIETPRTWSDPRRAAEEADGGVVLKPRRGSGAWGVRYVEGAAQLATSTSTSRDRTLIQERLCGEGLGVSLLYDETHRCVASFGHRRLREYPSTGGASTLRESAHLPEVESASRTLLESVAFVGPAMVEWKVDHRDGRPKLLEVNPRFWGSLALSVRAGVNFPHLLYRIACGERLPGASPAARPGVRARWFLPGDLMHFVERRDWRGLLRSLWPGAEPAAPDDLFSGDDLGAAVGALLSGIPFALRPEFRRFRRLARA